MKRINLSKSYTQEEVDKLLREQKKILLEEQKKRKQSECEHDYGRPDWLDSCAYTMTCSKCGYIYWGYERD